MADPLAKKIRLARQEAGISPEKMAVALGISVSTLMRIETGRSKDVSVKTVIKIAKLTKKPLSYFVGKVAA